MLRKVLASLILMGLFSSSVFAALSSSPGYFRTPQTEFYQFLPASTPGTYYTAYTGVTGGSKITGIYITSNDSTSHTVTCQFGTASVQYGGATITTGTTLPGFTSGVPAINLLSPTNWPGLPIDGDGNPFIYLPSSTYLITCTYATAVTAAKVVNVAVIGADT